MYIEQLYTNCLAEAAYYIESEGQAAVIDPLRETTPYLALAAKRNATIRYVFETHFHADFVSGHIDLARKAKAKIVYGPGADTSYEIYSAQDGEVFILGKVKIKVLHTPGHTPESTCYLLIDENGKEVSVFTGDTLFVGDVGRPDLLDGVLTSEELASMMYDSLNKKIKTLPDDVIVYPAHGPGSACGKNIGKETYSTIGIQKRTNYALRNMSREEFIAEVTTGIMPPPKYFFEDARINKKGYEPLDDILQKNNKPLSAAEFKKKLTEGATILDTRNADDFEKGFVPGSINIGLNGQFAVWVGTLVDINSTILLVTEIGKEEESILRLARIGFEKVEGFLSGGIGSWGGDLDFIQSVQASELGPILQQGTEIVDVRKDGEWKAGHVKGARLVPLADLPTRIKTLDKEKAYVIHCAGGYRSMTAISLLRKNGFKNLTNVQGGFGAIKQFGVPVETEVV